MEIENIHKRQVTKLVGKLGNAALSGGTLVDQCAKIAGIAFSGVYMQNQIPPLKNSTFIMNNDVTTGPGEHWVTGVINGKTIHVYDSFGRKSKNLLPIFTQQVKAKGYKVKNTDLSDQDQYGNTSVDCGHRCISALNIYKQHGLRGFRQL